RIALLVFAASVALATRAAVGQSASPPPLASHLARADSAFAKGDAAAASREYAAVLGADPENSHATYRLGQLRRHDPTTALRLFRRYVWLEPEDPWGYLALGDALARGGRYDEALHCYDEALRLAPAERDAVVGRARVLKRARQTGAAIAAYQQWLAAHPGDKEARRELAAARVAAAPAVTPLVGGTYDSDGNTTLKLGGSAELAAYGPTRLSVAGSREQVQGGGGGATMGLDELTLRLASRREAGSGGVLQIDAAGAATRLDAVVGGPRATVVATGLLRARWRATTGWGSPAIDLRAQRSVLDATPLLLANRLVRTEFGATVELPVAHAFKLRGIGRSAALSDSAELNHRTTFAGIAAFAAAPSIELSGQFHEIRYSHPTTAGYFAPRLIQVVEVGSYMEFETSRSVLLAFDLGVGVQRVAPQGVPLGPWRRALRAYSLIVWPLAAGGGRDLRLEVDSEDSGLAEAATTAQWRYLSTVLSLRWAVP
ncbi:MAG TPA: tetratricopeptide repeat protein, partial [Gemmatimonadales bacterium]|nr:tetratricopeptide repeat protein [Gemmatimonadales bacterium]